MSKILIGNAEIIDGTGASPFCGWVLVEGERIRAVSPTPLRAEDAEFVDARGLTLVPGFIDAHAHSDLSLLAAPEAEGKISQGITSEISGNCGLSAFPIRSEEVRAHLQEVYKIYGIPLEWNDFQSYTEVLSTRKPSINAGFLCGHNTLRANVLGYGNLQGTPTDLGREQRLLHEMLEQGALGLSSGLLYVPGKFASREEMTGLAAILREFDRPYTTHLRSEGERLLESVEEALEVAASAGIRLHLSHLKTAQPRNWHKIDALLKRLAEARSGGLRVTADRYPYTSGQTSFSVVLPPPCDDLTDRQIQDLLRNSPKERLRLQQELMRHPRDWRAIILCTTRHPEFSHFGGRTIQEIADILKRPPEEICMDCLTEDATGAMAAFCGMSEENLDRLLLEEFVCCGTDETARPVSEQLGRSHPRGFGSFPRWIRRSLRLGLPLERTIQRLTQLPATIFSLSERGEIRPGFYADLVLFSRESLIDRADFGHPHRLSEGIFSVYVNGELSFFENRVRGHAGKILKK